MKNRLKVLRAERDWSQQGQSARSEALMKEKPCPIENSIR